MFNPPKWGEHAPLKRITHGITIEQIAETWVYGELESTNDPKNPGCWRLIGKKITLVLSPNGDFIITMYPNKYQDRHAGKRVANAVSIGATRWED